MTAHKMLFASNRHFISVYPFIVGFLLIVMGISLLGCRPPATYEVAKANVAKTKNEIDQQENKQYPAPAPVVTRSSPYVDTTKLSLIRRPAWLSRQITMNGHDLPFNFYLSQVLDGTGVIVQYDKEIDKGVRLSLDYNGEAHGALDELANKTGYYYDLDYQSNMLVWSPLMTTIFDVSFMPGTSQYNVGKGRTTSTNTSTTADFGYDITSDSQYSQLLGDISLWKDLEATIKNLMSEKGKVSVSQATTTVTVNDYPANVKSISKYIEKMNRELSKQVRLHVDILEVKLSDDFIQGINWDLIHVAGDQVISLVSNNFDNVNLVGTDLAANQFAFKGDKAKGSPWLDTNTIIKMLSEQGNVQTINRPTMTTLNNQVAQLAVQELENYISQITNTLNDNFSQSSAETATVTTGIMVYLLPKIQNNNVFLQVSTNLSVLDKLTSQDTGALAATSGSSESSGSIVQLPKVSQRIMNQRAVVPTGKCLIISGFKRLLDETANSQLYGVQALGGMGSKREASEIVMLITPTILSTEDTIDPTEDVF